MNHLNMTQCDESNHITNCTEIVPVTEIATNETYSLSLHDALPIWVRLLPPISPVEASPCPRDATQYGFTRPAHIDMGRRSEEHTSELQSHVNLVCRLLLEKKNIAMRVDTRVVKLWYAMLLVVAFAA